MTYPDLKVSFTVSRSLQAEYDSLRQSYDMASVMRQLDMSTAGDSTTLTTADMVAEAKALRQHKGRLETRMTILDEHNKQLEAQLVKLKMLLNQVLVAHLYLMRLVHVVHVVTH